LAQGYFSQLQIRLPNLSLISERMARTIAARGASPRSGTLTVVTWIVAVTTLTSATPIALGEQLGALTADVGEISLLQTDVMLATSSHTTRSTTREKREKPAIEWQSQAGPERTTASRHETRDIIAAASLLLVPGWGAVGCADSILASFQQVPNMLRLVAVGLICVKHSIFALDPIGAAFLLSMVGVLVRVVEKRNGSAPQDLSMLLYPIYASMVCFGHVLRASYELTTAQGMESAVLLHAGSACQYVSLCMACMLLLPRFLSSTWQEDMGEIARCMALMVLPRTLSAASGQVVDSNRLQLLLALLAFFIGNVVMLIASELLQQLQHWQGASKTTPQRSSQPERSRLESCPPTTERNPSGMVPSSLLDELLEQIDNKTPVTKASTRG